MQRHGQHEGDVHVGFVHYNTADEVGRVLGQLDEL